MKGKFSKKQKTNTGVVSDLYVSDLHLCPATVCVYVPVCVCVYAQQEAQLRICLNPVIW